MTDFREGFQYLGGVLQFIQHSEGYVNYLNAGGGKYNYVYHIKDHLGNIRVSFTKQLTNNTAKLLKENHYYPFGLKHPYNSTEFDYYYNTSTSSLGIGPMTNSNRYQYNSKEWQNELSLNLYDYGARMFDPAIGRWGVVDPLAEKYPEISPFAYCANNPVIAKDPNGKEIIFVIRNADGDVKEQLTYRNGNFWHSNGNRYNPAKENLSKTLYNVLDSYRRILKSEDRHLNKMLKTLELSKNKHYISESMIQSTTSSYPFNEEGVKQGESVGTSVGYALSKSALELVESTNKEKTSIMAIVAHEMQHQFDYEIGNMKDAVQGNSASDPEEIRAVYSENLAKKYQNIPLSTKYGGVKIDKNKLNKPPNFIE